jgi:signal transduction histidine kinase
VAAALDVGTLFDGATNRWERRLHDAGRSLDVEDAATNAAARGSMVSMSQVLDVLIDNGLRHGAGMVRLRSRVTSGGVVLEVSDVGEGIAAGVDVFDRHATDGGHGIGLALARSIVEAEGGRLLLATPRPPCFHVVLPTADG